MTITRTTSVVAEDEPRRANYVVLGVVAALALAIVAVAVYLLMLRQGETSPYTVDVALTEPTAGNRVVPARTECPENGRATGSLAGSFQPAGDQPLRSTYGPGQIVVFQFLVGAGDAAAADVTPEFVAAWDRSRGGASGFDPAIGIYCAFVDPSDPATVENPGEEPMSVRWAELPPDNSDIRGKFAVPGMDAGERAVVEVWMVLTDNGSTDPISAQVRLEESEETFRAAPTRPTLDLRIEFFDLLEQVLVELKMSDPTISTGVEVDRRERIVYELEVTNLSDKNVANDVRLSDSVDPATRVLSLSVEDDEGAITTCTADRDDEGFTCDLAFLNPSEVVRIFAEVRVTSEAEVRWIKEDGDCEDSLQDVCNRALVQWSRSPTLTGDSQIDEPSNIPNASVLSVAKLSQFTVAYPGEEVPFTYAVTTTASSQLSEIVVTDSGCQPIDFEDGDDDSDLRLDPDEEWFFSCTVETVDVDDEKTEVTVTALDGSGTPITRTEIVELRLIDPGITIRPTENQPAGERRRFQVAISGNDPLDGIEFSASNCVDPTFEGGDIDEDGSLGEGESWIYSCRKESAQAPITARVYGTDSRGAAVTDNVPFSDRDPAAESEEDDEDAE